MILRIAGGGRGLIQYRHAGSKRGRRRRTGNTKTEEWSGSRCRLNERSDSNCGISPSTGSRWRELVSPAVNGLIGFGNAGRFRVLRASVTLGQSKKAQTSPMADGCFPRCRPLFLSVGVKQTEGKSRKSYQRTREQRSTRKSTGAVLQTPPNFSIISQKNKQERSTNSTDGPIGNFDRCHRHKYSRRDGTGFGRGPVKVLDRRKTVSGLCPGEWVICPLRGAQPAQQNGLGKVRGPGNRPFII